MFDISAALLLVAIVGMITAAFLDDIPGPRE